MSSLLVGFEFLSTCYPNIIFLFGLIGYLAMSCGVCDTSAPIDFQETYEQREAHSQTESVGFDINPAMSPVFAKGATESNFDVNVFEEPKEELSWWNVRILCGGGSSTTSL
ncbi:hypothetical protein L3Y34_004539 [Caenorhabditis briggsae]|uniref:Uncharacterized protein n=1 Tax=Caenorhabditis briggsae TaxID=6238 RepID=A0AAE9D735_CAEBR|nr:hypothetical protein L3Y34_004539 [Caenorhabditis briggsae]